MQIRRFIAVTVSVALLYGWTPHLPAASPFIELGPADELALDQPRVAVELVDPVTGISLGPNTANTFLLDTAANSILIVDDAIFELNANGYRTEGTFLEQGVGGFTEFDVSAPYDINYAGSDGQIETISSGRVLSSTTESFCPIPGLCSFFGIIGMPAMENKVTTLSLASLGGDGGNLTLDDLLAGNFSAGIVNTTFGSSLPETELRRYRVPLTPGVFPAEGDGPLPSWSDLPFMNLTAANGDTQKSGNFVLDTGAQLSLLSSEMAFGLGLDTNGNGSLRDEAIGFQDIGGVGGTVSAPIMLFDELRLPTAEGVDLVFTNLQAAIIDIDPTIDGIFGMNMLSSGWSGSLFSGFGDLADLFNDAGLGDLFGLLGGAAGGGSPFGFFDQVHFDFRDWASGRGELVLDLTPEVRGVMAFDGTHGDLDGDGDVDLEDRTIWVHDVNGTVFGDSNLDGVFNSQDLVDVFVVGQYEDDISMNSTWSTGDWNMDGEFSTQDMVLAFQDGGYVTNATAQIPEPASAWLLIWGVAAGLARIRTRRKSP